MKIGAPFNPYKVFQGAFAPYWLLEHPGLAAGAKLCYIRLLGFAGKDARCYPSLETLGKSLGVSERQARDYVKELERSGLIVVEQRGLRKTNVYLFVWTAELEQLVSSVPNYPDDSEDQGHGPAQNTPPDRNNSSGQDRHRASAPDRNSCSAQDRNTPSGPIGINSSGISSMESTSSSGLAKASTETKTKMTGCNRQLPVADSLLVGDRQHTNPIAQAILEWAKHRRLRRLRSDRRTGLPEKEQLAEWSEILDGMEIAEQNQIFALMDRARGAADRVGGWRTWSFLTLQIQLAAERMTIAAPLPTAEVSRQQVSTDEDPNSEWSQVKAKIRTDLAEIPFMNWFQPTREISRCGTAITIAVPDEQTRAYLEDEYGALIERAISRTGIKTLRFVVQGGSNCGDVRLVSKVRSG